MPFKILHVINTCDPASGGPVEGLKQLYKSYKKNKIHCEILSSDTIQQARKFQYGLPFINATGPSITKFNYNPKLIKWLNTNIYRFDHIIVNGIWLYHNYAVWKIASKTNTPFSIFPHGALDPWFKKKYPIKHFIKNIIWYLFQKKIFKCAKSIFFTTDLEKYLANKTFNFKDIHSKTVGYGIFGNNNLHNKTNLFLKKNPKLKSKKLLVFLGRIHEKKGLDILIKTFLDTYDLNKNFHLVIAGTGEKKLINKLKSSIPEKNKNNITWTGLLLKKIKWDLFKSAYLFCLPSHQENFGISVVEALSSKVPVLISNEVNIHKIITKYNAGIVSKDNFISYKKNYIKIIKLLEKNYKQISDNSLKCFKKEFFIDNYFNNLIKNL